MGNITQINIKNWTYFFFNGMINIKDFDSDKNIGVYSIGYITIKEIDDLLKELNWKYS